jgi:hypothetical protein
MAVLLIPRFRLPGFACAWRPEAVETLVCPLQQQNDLVYMGSYFVNFKTQAEGSKSHFFYQDWVQGINS